MLDARPGWQSQLARIAQQGSGEQRLLAAILTDAMAALRGRHPEARMADREKGCASPAELWIEAVAWVKSHTVEPFGTFESICAALELPTARVRRDLLALAAQHATEIGIAGVMQLVALPLDAFEAAP